MDLRLKPLPDLAKRGGEHTRSRRQKTAGRAQVNFAETVVEAQADAACPVRVEPAGLELPDFRTLHDRDDGSNYLEKPALFRLLPDNEVHVVLLYERNPVFYILNFMLLLNGITTCAAFGWAVPWQAVSDRLSLDVTLLLTSIAFKQVLAGTVPPISYLTRLDAYALGSLFFLLVATAMHATIGYMVDFCGDDGNCSFDVAGMVNANARTIDNIFFYSWLGLWVIANIVYTISVKARLERGRAQFSLANAKARGFAPAEVPRLDSKEWYEEEIVEGVTGGTVDMLLRSQRVTQRIPLTSGV